MITFLNNSILVLSAVCFLPLLIGGGLFLISEFFRKKNITPVENWNWDDVNQIPTSRMKTINDFVYRTKRFCSYCGVEVGFDALQHCGRQEFVEVNHVLDGYLYAETAREKNKSYRGCTYNDLPEIKAVVSKQELPLLEEKGNLVIERIQFDSLEALKLHIKKPSLYPNSKSAENAVIQVEVQQWNSNVFY